MPADSPKKWDDLIGIGIAFVAAICGALAVVFVRKLASNIHYSVVGFYYFFGNLIFCPIWTFFQQRDHFPKYGLNFALFMVAIGVSYFIM